MSKTGGGSVKSQAKTNYVIRKTRGRPTTTEKIKSKVDIDKNSGKQQTTRVEKSGNILISGKIVQLESQQETKRLEEKEEWEYGPMRNNLEEEDDREYLTAEEENYREYREVDNTNGEMTGMEKRILNGIIKQSREIRIDIRREISQCKESLRSEIEELRREMKMKEVRWEKEKDTMEEKIKRIDEKLKRVEQQEGDWKKEIELKIETIENGVEGRRINRELKEIKRTLERNEIKERRNIIIKGAELTEGNVKEKVEKLLQEELNFDEDVASAKRIKLGLNKNEAVIIRLPNMESKKTIMERKRLLRRTQT